MNITAIILVFITTNTGFIVMYRDSQQSHFFNTHVLIVTWHEKIGLMCTKYIALLYSMYLIICVSYIHKFCKLYKISYPLCSELVTKVSLISYCMLMNQLMKLKSPKTSQILCVNQPYFLTPGHNSTVNGERFAALNIRSFKLIKVFMEIFSWCLDQQCLLFNHS